VDDENLEKWFRTGDLSHCFLGKEYVKAFFSTALSEKIIVSPGV